MRRSITGRTRVNAIAGWPLVRNRHRRGPRAVIFSICGCLSMWKVRDDSSANSQVAPKLTVHLPSSTVLIYVNSPLIMSL